MAASPRRMRKPNLRWKGIGTLPKVCSIVRVSKPAVIALLACELISLAVHESEEKIELAELVRELGLELSDFVTARAVVLLDWAYGNETFPLADHKHHAITCSRLTPELSRSALRPRRCDNLPNNSAAVKRSRLERIVRQLAQR